MKKLILFIVLTLAASQAFAGPYECEQRCDKEMGYCDDQCTKYTGYEWQNCMNACHRQFERCKNNCN